MKLLDGRTKSYNFNLTVDDFLSTLSIQEIILGKIHHAITDLLKERDQLPIKLQISLQDIIEKTVESQDKPLDKLINFEPILDKKFFSRSIAYMFIVSPEKRSIMLKKLVPKVITQDGLLDLILNSGLEQWLLAEALDEDDKDFIKILSPKILSLLQKKHLSINHCALMEYQKFTYHLIDNKIIPDLLDVKAIKEMKTSNPEALLKLSLLIIANLPDLRAQKFIRAIHGTDNFLNKKLLINDIKTSIGIEDKSIYILARLDKFNKINNFFTSINLKLPDSILLPMSSELIAKKDKINLIIKKFAKEVFKESGINLGSCKSFLEKINLQKASNLFQQKDLLLYAFNKNPTLFDEILKLHNNFLPKNICKELMRPDISQEIRKQISDKLLSTNFTYYKDLITPKDLVEDFLFTQVKLRNAEYFIHIECIATIFTRMKDNVDKNTDLSFIHFFIEKKSLDPKYFTTMENAYLGPGSNLSSRLFSSALEKNDKQALAYLIRNEIGLPVAKKSLVIWAAQNNHPELINTLFELKISRAFDKESKMALTLCQILSPECQASLECLQTKRVEPLNIDASRLTDTDKDLIKSVKDPKSTHQLYEILERDSAPRITTFLLNLLSYTDKKTFAALQYKYPDRVQNVTLPTTPPTVSTDSASIDSHSTITSQSALGSMSEAFSVEIIKLKSFFEQPPAKDGPIIIKHQRAKSKLKSGF